MKRKPFDPNELEVIGLYPALYNSDCIPSQKEPKRNCPITPKENLKLALNGERPYWIPYTGWTFCDVLAFRPRMNPDNVVARNIYDTIISLIVNQLRGLFVKKTHHLFLLTHCMN